MRCNPKDEAFLSRLTFRVKRDEFSEQPAWSMEAWIGKPSWSGDVRGRLVACQEIRLVSGELIGWDDLIVHRPYRRMGVATALMEFAEKETGYRFGKPPKTTAAGKALFKAWNKRPNPPAEIDHPGAGLNECAVIAIAAATGRSVPDARRAFLAAGVDIWTGKNNEATGTPLESIRKVIKHLDYDRKIVEIGTPTRGTRMLVGDAAKMRFLYGKAPAHTVEEGFGFPGTAKLDVADPTIGQLVKRAKRDGLAMIALTSSIVGRRHVGKATPGGFKPVTRKFVGRTHLVGYSPSMGFYDTGRARSILNKLGPEADAARAEGPGRWNAHGDNVPDPLRRAAMWVYFRGE